jgi:hypothetical protein
MTLVRRSDSTIGRLYASGQREACSGRTGHLSRAVEFERRISTSDERGRGMAKPAETLWGFTFTWRVSTLREFQQSLEDKPWGIYEFAMSDPDEALVRRLANASPGRSSIASAVRPVSDLRTAPVNVCF